MGVPVGGTGGVPGLVGRLLRRTHLSPLSPPRSHRYPLRRPPQARRWYAC